MLTQAQRMAIEGGIVRARRGPSMHTTGIEFTKAEAEKQARIWSDSWVADMLLDVLANDDGVISAARLSEDWGNA